MHIMTFKVEICMVEVVFVLFHENTVFRISFLCKVFTFKR